MSRSNSFQRWLTACLLFSMLGIGILGNAGKSVHAAPSMQASSGDVVISEFRTSGPSGGSDEFIEIYNRTNSSINIGGWLLQRSSSTGSISGNPRYTFNTGITLLPGQHFLVVGTSYSGSVSGDATGVSLGIADDGGLALTLADGVTKIDEVGMSSGSAYLEGTSLLPLSGSSDQSYLRKNNGCTDTDDNSTDFALQSPSDPQNSTDTPVKCLRVVNVTSTTADGTYDSTYSSPIEITVEFNSNVNVTGSPTLLLETGVTNRTATYASGSGSTMLTFNYTVQSGDVSDDLDYVATSSLSLNGGSITGAVGDADLTLPAPGDPGSLSWNKDIVIDNGIAPSLLSFERQNPLAGLTNSDTLTFRVTFGEPVTGVDAGDFSVTGTTGTITSVTPEDSSVYDVVISGGDLAGLNGDVGLNLDGAQDIVDAVGNPLPSGEPAIDEIYTLDNAKPTVVIDQASGQADPASGTPVLFTVTFSEDIDVGTFTTGDISQNGTISSSLITWSISGGPRVFTLSATAIAGNGTLIPSIDAGTDAVPKVMDLAGNHNQASTTTTLGITDTVTFTDNIAPSVTINQAVGQADPANTLPINFTIIFSEPIVTSIFTTADITQNGTATGITWNLTDSGDHRTFTLSATNTADYGTLIPTIGPNRVTDLVGNNNTASTSTDNSVEYVTTKPLSVVINEVAWAGTAASSADEWIELYNPGTTDIDLTDWMLASTDGSPSITLSGTIEAGKYFLIEHGNDATDDDTVADVTADLIYTSGTLSNSGEILRLYDPNNIVVDSANSNGSSWPAGSLFTYSSMERSFINTDSDFVWVTYDPVKDSIPESSREIDRDGNVIMGTPGRANSQLNVAPTATPQGSSGSGSSGSFGGSGIPPVLIISEFLPRPGHDWNNDGVVNVDDEFIEILNAGSVDVNLSAYILDDARDLDNGVVIGSPGFPLPDIILGPDERIVFYANDSGLHLSDAGEEVSLRLAARQRNPETGQLYVHVVDIYEYGVVHSPDYAWCRVPDRPGPIGPWNDPCFPTPGNPNALTGTFPPLPGPVADVRELACLLPDSTPAPFVYAECESNDGDDIWNRQYWDGLDGAERLEISKLGKWGTLFE